MRKLCPNFEREDCLDTVLEVPIPEEMFGATNKSTVLWWQSMKGWMRTTAPDHKSHPTRNAEIQLLLGVVGAPLIPLPIPPNSDHQIIKDHPIESSMGKYIVKQYMAAVGGEKAVKSIESMYAMGKVKMVSGLKPAKNSVAGVAAGDMGGFVLWQKGPELWCLELVVAGCKISAGSDGKLAWRQTPWHHSHASRGPPRPLRRFLQGLDPASTADLFSGSACVGEKEVDGHACFVLKLEADPAVLRSRSTASVRMMRHTLWGYFSQRTGLLVHLRDSHLLTIKSSSDPNDNIFWETTMESSIGDYRPVEGVLIAHSGRTMVTLFRFGESSHAHSTTRMEEAWEIEEVDFNIKGLSMDCFLPPGDLKQDRHVEPRLPFQIRSASFRIGAAAAIHVRDDDTTTDEDDDEYHL